jgi:hypothetical protein
MAVKFLVSYLFFTDVAAFASYVLRKWGYVCNAMGGSIRGGSLLLNIPAELD